MPTVYIGFDVSQAAEARIAEMLHHEKLHNPDWSGADLRLERDEQTYVDGGDELAATQLLSKVMGIAEDYQ